MEFIYIDYESNPYLKELAKQIDRNLGVGKTTALIISTNQHGHGAKVTSTSTRIFNLLEKDFIHNEKHFEGEYRTSIHIAPQPLIVEVETKKSNLNVILDFSIIFNKLAIFDVVTNKKFSRDLLYYYRSKI